MIAGKNVTAKIEDVFCKLMERCPQHNGLQFWSNVYKTNAGNIKEIVKGIATSNEFYKKFIVGDKNAAVQALYLKLLGRNANQGRVGLAKEIFCFLFLFMTKI